jgi:large subunit ribosomal protein L6
MKKTLKKTVAIPEGTSVELELPKVIVQGPLGKSEREFRSEGVELKKTDNKIVIECAAATKKEKKEMNSIAAHIANMIIGVAKGFEYRLQVCSIHFPITVKLDNEKNALVIKNFLGERKDREVELSPDIKTTIEGDIITLNGLDVEKVSQFAADIETATKIKARDRRVYQDGIFIISKAGVDV